MADADVEGLTELVLLPAGSTFGNYVIHECIGQGAMGNVYRAEHALLEKAVALKVLDSSLLQSADARQRFLREGQAAAAIKHPNVVDITDVGVFEGTPYLVMELLEGEDLQIHLARREQLSEREIASLLIPIAAALGAAHDRGVVHRDLKPSNIFLARGPDGEVVPKILDFGISKVARALATTDFESTPFDQLMGSPLYLPPEAVRGSRDLTAKSDQYSLGVVLYECVTGRPPFAGDSLLSILNQIAAGDFVRPSRLRSDVSVGMEHAVVRALNPDPALRFEHVRDLGRELLEVAGMRTQMLWGRTFGRIDLSEPPFDPRSTSPVALLRLASSPVAPAPKPRAVRRILLGVAALAVISIACFWSLRSFYDGAPPGAMTALARAPETGDAELAPAWTATGRLTAAPAPFGDRLPPADPLPSDPSSALPGATSTSATSGLTAASSLPSGTRGEPASLGLSRLGAAATAPAAPGPSVRVLAERGFERPRSSKRARAAVTPEPRSHRLSLVPDLRPRPRPELVGEPSPDEARELFPASVRDATPRDPAPRAKEEPVYSGANESPILD